MSDGYAEAALLIAAGLVIACPNCEYALIAFEYDRKRNWLGLVIKCRFCGDACVSAEAETEDGAYYCHVCDACICATFESHRSARIIRMRYERA